MENIEEPVTVVITNEKKSNTNDPRILKARGGDFNNPETPAFKVMFLWTGNLMSALNVSLYSFKFLQKRSIPEPFPVLRVVSPLVFDTLVSLKSGSLTLE